MRTTTPRTMKDSGAPWRTPPEETGRHRVASFEKRTSLRCDMTTERRTVVGLVMLISILVLGGCSQPLSTREKGTLVGGGLGAASGAIIGSAVGSPGAGAAIGGAMGALSGGLIGDQLQGLKYRAARQQSQISRQNRELQRQRRDIEKLKRQARSNDDES